LPAFGSSIFVWSRVTKLRNKSKLGFSDIGEITRDHCVSKYATVVYRYNTDTRLRLPEIPIIVKYPFYMSSSFFVRKFRKFQFRKIPNLQRTESHHIGRTHRQIWEKYDCTMLW